VHFLKSAQDNKKWKRGKGLKSPEKSLTLLSVFYFVVLRQYIKLIFTNSDFQNEKITS